MPPPISPIVRIGFYCFCVLPIVTGLINLFFGFQSGEMYWVSKYGRDSWMSYEGYKRAFIYLGFLYTWMIVFGAFMLRVLALDARKVQ
jgi:hypothetical protein